LPHASSRGSAVKSGASPIDASQVPQKSPFTATFPFVPGHVPLHVPVAAARSMIDVDGDDPEIVVAGVSGS